jgi:hypothetical protein
LHPYAEHVVAPKNIHVGFWAIDLDEERKNGDDTPKSPFRKSLVSVTLPPPQSLAPRDPVSKVSVSASLATEPTTAKSKHAHTSQGTANEHAESSAPGLNDGSSKVVDQCPPKEIIKATTKKCPPPPLSVGSNGQKKVVKDKKRASFVQHEGENGWSPSRPYQQARKLKDVVPTMKSMMDSKTPPWFKVPVPVYLEERNHRCDRKKSVDEHGWPI